MTARTHDLAAITLLTVVFLAQPVEAIRLSTIIVAVFANLVGGITPDIDQPTAPFWRNLPVMRMFGRFFDRILGGHRFITHSIIGLVVFGFLSHWLLIFLHPIMKNIDIGVVWWAYMIGMFSHLVMDTLTKEGVPWLLPIPIKFGFPPIRAFRITTGKVMETFAVFPGLLALEALLLYINYPMIIELLRKNIVR